MKLRNKKTSEVYDVLISAYGISGDVAVSVMDDNAKSGYADLGRYKTLAELNEEWEDYTPAEPLIKDEKIRKAVRVWTEAVGKSDDLIEFDESAGSLWCNRSRIQFDNTELKGLKNWQKYTIAELCGEEQE